MKLTTKKSKPCKCCVIKNLFAHDISEKFKKFNRYISNEHIQYIAKNEYQIPDSIHCKNALKFVSEHSPTHLLNHCLRSYSFGVAMAHKVKRKYDKEVLFLGSIMHDLGLTDSFLDNETFELTGAKAAKEFCMENNISEEKADLVHEMIALHTSVGIAHKKEPEIALLHFGAGIDVAQLWLDDVHKKTIEEIISEYPRLDFNEAMAKLLKDQIKVKPHSFMKTIIDLGFLEKVKIAHL